MSRASFFKLLQVILAFFKFTLISVVPTKYALLKSDDVKSLSVISASIKFALFKNAPVKSQLFILVRIKFIPVKSTPIKFIPSKLSSEKSCSV